MHARIFSGISNNCSNMMFKSEYVRKTENDYAEFCINHCPHEDCEKGICKEFKEFKKNHKKEVCE